MISEFLRGAPPLLDDRFPLPLDLPFTGRQARGVGISADVLMGLTRSGYIRGLAQNVYVAAQVPDSRELRGRALALIAPPHSVVCDWTACWYWTGVDRPGRHLAAEIDVFRCRGRERLRNGLARSGQRWFLDEDLVPLGDGLQVTTQIRTAWDLGRFYRPVVAMGGMDALLATGAFDLGRLVDGVERFKRQRGVVLLRWLAPRVDPRSESPGESALRVRWHEAPGLPWPRPQLPILSPTGAEIYRLDLADEETRFAAEYDGEEWHGVDQQPADEERRGQIRESHAWELEVLRRGNVYGDRADASVRLANAYRAARITLPMRLRSRR